MGLDDIPEDVAHAASDLYKRMDKHLLQGLLEFSQVWAETEFNPQLVEVVQPKIVSAVFGIDNDGEEEILDGLANLDFPLIEQIVRNSSGVQIGIIPITVEDESILEGPTLFNYLKPRPASEIEISYGDLYIHNKFVKATGLYEWKLIFETDVPEILCDSSKDGKLVLGDVSPKHYLAIEKPKTYHILFRNSEAKTHNRNSTGTTAFETIDVRIRVTYPGTLGGDPHTPATNVCFDSARMGEVLANKGGLETSQIERVIAEYIQLEQERFSKEDAVYSRQSFFTALATERIEIDPKTLFQVIVVYEKLAELNENLVPPCLKERYK